MNTVSLYRLKYLFLQYFIINWKRDLKTFSILFLIKIIFTYLHFPFPDELIVVIMSIIFAGNIFNFLNNKHQGISYLMLPLNTVEKVFVNIILVHAYYSLMLLLACFSGEIIGHLFYTLRTGLVFIFPDAVGELFSYDFLLQLIAIQSIFIFTSVYFRKNAILKTLFVFVIVFFILVFIIGYMLIRLHMGNISEPFLMNIIAGLMEKYTLIFSAFNYIIILFFWILSYFRLRETEV